MEFVGRAGVGDGFLNGLAERFDGRPVDLDDVQQVVDLSDVSDVCWFFCDSIEPIVGIVEQFYQDITLDFGPIHDGLNEENKE